MYYLVVEDVENNVFGFTQDGWEEIKDSYIPITEADYNKYFELLSNGKQFRIKDVNGTSLFEIIEEYVKEVIIEKTPLDCVAEDNIVFKKQQINQDVNISLTEEAVNFIIMGTMNNMLRTSLYDDSDVNINNNGGNGMGSYLGNQIYKGKLEYNEVIAKYPQFKEDIDSFLELKLAMDGLVVK